MPFGSSVDEALVCGVRREDDEVFGVNAQGEEELEAADEGKQVEKVQALPTPYQPTHSEYCDHCVMHFSYQS